MPKKSALDLAAAAVRENRWEEALEALLGLWATKRPAALAMLIEAVAAHLPPLTLITELSGKLKSTEIAKRLKALGALPPDPRISNHYLQMLAAPPFTAGSSKKMWLDILNQLSTSHLDPRTPPKMRELEPGYLSIFGATVMGKSMKFQLKVHAKKIDAALAKLEMATEAELQAMAAILALVPAIAATPVASEPPDDHAYFWNRIAESPSDPVRKAEYRRWLAARNDPRAEFIAIQESKRIHGRLPPKEKAREQELFDKHHKEWLGPIGPIAAYPIFEDGYLSTCMLKPKGALTGKLAGHPLWATVREMDVGYNKEQGHAVVLHPVMKSLKKLTTVNLSLFTQLLRDDAPPRPIEEIESWAFYRELIRPDQPAPGLPHLKRLELQYDEDDDEERAEEYLPFWSSPLVARLEYLRITNWAVDWSDWKDFVMTGMPDRVRASIDLADFIFRRGADGKYSSVEVSLQIDDNGNLYDRNSKTYYMKSLAEETWPEITIRKPAKISAATWSVVEKIFSEVNHQVI